jgi:hypothetical protein
VSVPALERKRVWRVLVLLAPLAAVVGVYLAYRVSPAARLGLTVSRNDVVAMAATEAAARGVRTEGWRSLVDLQVDNDLRHYLVTTATRAERSAVERLYAPVHYRGYLENAEHPQESVRVTVSPDGRLLSYRVPPTGGNAPAAEGTARAAAEAELRRRLGTEWNGFRFVSTDLQRQQATDTDIRRFTYRRTYGKDLALEATVDTSGAGVTAFALTPRLAPAHAQRFPELGMRYKIIRGVTFGLVIAGGLIYVVARFIRRLRENEIPLKRTAIVAVFVFVAFAFSTRAGSVSQNIEALERGAGSRPNVEVIVAACTGLVIAVLVGITWGACEADLREAYPEKLTSLDALLGGFFSSRAVRSSLSTGLTFAAYATLVATLDPLLRGDRVWTRIVDGELVPYQMAYPALALVLFAVVSVPVTLTILFAAVSATHRGGTTRKAQLTLAVVTLLFFVLSAAGSHSPVAWGVVVAIASAAVVLVPFLLGDVLALFVAVGGSAWLLSAAAMIAQRAPAFRSSGWMMLGGLAVVVAGGAAASFRKRDGDGEPAVGEAARPEYARNIAERLMLTTEMDAARQAQLRVMPRSVPSVDGTKLAARHSASAEIGSDYYEFFPTPGHVSVAVADARSPGLSSALCVSMLKGLLLNYSARLNHPRDVADRVYRQLATIFGDDLPVSFFFGRLDRATGDFTFATFGAAPRAVLVRDGIALSLEGEEYVPLQPSDVLVIYTARLAEMRNREGEPLGQEALHAELSGTPGRDPQHLVDALYEVAARQSRGSEEAQSWAAVAVSLAPALETAPA